MDISLTYPTTEPSVRYYCISCNEDYTEEVDRRNYNLLKEFAEKLLKEQDEQKM